MTATDALFDLDEFGPGTTPRQRHAKPEIPVEPWKAPWTWVRDHVGVRPYAHLIRAHTGTGAVITCCGITAIPISNEGEITQMIRCPECDLAPEMQQLSLV